MKKTQKTDSVKRWDIITSVRLYEALPPGKVSVLTEYMNGIINPPMSEEKVRLWFGAPERRVPRKHREFYLEIMADALRDAAESLKSAMSDKAIALKKEADKAANELATVKNELEKDTQTRKMLEVVA